jgi:hypothetical protein
MGREQAFFLSWGEGDLPKFLVSSHYSGETMPELVEGRWFRQAQPTPPRFIEMVQFLPKKVG